MKNKRYIFKIKLPTAKEKGLCVSVCGGRGVEISGSLPHMGSKIFILNLRQGYPFLKYWRKKGGGGVKMSRPWNTYLLPNVESQGICIFLVKFSYLLSNILTETLNSTTVKNGDGVKICPQNKLVFLNCYKTVSEWIRCFVYLTREGLHKIIPRKDFFFKLARKREGENFQGRDILTLPPSFTYSLTRNEYF